MAQKIYWVYFRIHYRDHTFSLWLFGHRHMGIHTPPPLRPKTCWRLKWMVPYPYQVQERDLNMSSRMSNLYCSGKCVDKNMTVRSKAKKGMETPPPITIAHNLTCNKRGLDMQYVKPNYFKKQHSLSSFLLTYSNNTGPKWQ